MNIEFDYWKTLIISFADKNDTSKDMIEILKGDSKDSNSKSNINLTYIENIFINICPNINPKYDPKLNFP